jgi:primosomal protein N' (replication factor Y)
MDSMQYYEVAPTQIIRPKSSVFTYAHPDQLDIGQIVIIEVGRKQLLGVIFRKVDQPDYETKQINQILDEQALPIALLELVKWLSSYYATHTATVLQMILPRGIQKNRRERQTADTTRLRNRTKNVFNNEQLTALKQIDETPSGTILLHGITGSGKTAVYIETARKILKSGRSVIVLVPEIALTPQVVDEFAGHFDNVLLTHSRQTEAERHLLWRDALTSDHPRVVIGPRSALFMPLKNIGLIIIDEAHEPSFKQEQSPRYSALRAASVLASQHSAKLILGSATPSMSDYFIAKTSNRPIIEMNTTARPASPPVVTLVDMTKRNNFRRHRFLSDILIAQLEQTFASGKQALVFHNRRGSASTTLCENCGWQATCPRCFVPLTLHADQHELRCHICGINDKVPTSCPVCHHTNIIHKGIGTKLIESELAKLFPKVHIGRFDGDSDADQSLDARYKQLYDGSIDLIIGTQIVAKGLDLPHLRTVGVVQADAGLGLPDYSAAERTFQLLAQVVGRVGRSDHATSVIVQSYQPSHPAVIDGLSQNYADFYEKIIAERKRAVFPPFTFLLKLTCVYKTEAAAIRNAQTLARSLQHKLHADIEILGPTPAFYERQRDTYRWQLILKSKNRSALVDALEHVPSTHWQFELDPISLL